MNQVLEITMHHVVTTLQSNFIGPVVQTNTAADADQSDTVAQSNGAQVTQNLQAVNDCDEENTGDNLATCSNDQPSEFTIDSL